MKLNALSLIVVMTMAAALGAAVAKAVVPHRMTKIEFKHKFGDGPYPQCPYDQYACDTFGAFCGPCSGQQ